MKVFRDSVHGYIQVPAEWCRRFVDTPIFQRLRHIDQTSMRCLYPSARHDRFIHSFGTYHLGKKAFHALRENAKDLIHNLGVSNEDLDKYEKTFLVACLLHDCGHAPFSHTFEGYYGRGYGLKPQLQELFTDDKSFVTDFESCKANEHEKASAIIVLMHFRDELINLTGADGSLLVGRMIMGCKYHDCASDDRKRFENALIMLLNGDAVDVDKLDYITRDTWASGVDNVSIDLDRLLGAVTIVDHGYKIVPAFKKQALSVVQSVVDARNNLYRWIYGHHKVCYDQYLLVTGVEKLAALLGKHEDINRDDALATMFSMKTFNDSQLLGGGAFHMLTDGDLLYLLKCHQGEIPEAREWFSRKHSRKSVWKTRAEFELHFENTSLNDRNEILKRFDAVRDRLDGGSEYLCREVEIKESRIKRDELFIVFEAGCVSYTKIFGEGENKPEGRFFYLYQPINDTKSVAEIVTFLKELV